MEGESMRNNSRVPGRLRKYLLLESLEFRVFCMFFFWFSLSQSLRRLRRPRRPCASCVFGAAPRTSCLAGSAEAVAGQV